MDYTRSCRNCIHCNIEEMKCYPESKDCEEVYLLEESDLDDTRRCDFFERRNEDGS